MGVGMSAQQEMVEDLPVVKASHFADLGFDYWRRDYDLDPWDAGKALERLQELLHEKGQEEEGDALVLQSDHLERFRYTPNGYKSRREIPLVRMPYHPDVLPHWDAYAIAKKDLKDLATIRITDIAIPPAPFLGNNLLPIMKNSNNSLTTLDLVHCRLSSKDVACVAKFLSKNASLVALDLTSSAIDTVKVARDLSKAMKEHPALRFANLSHCGLGNNAVVLSAILGGSVNLSSLIIENNDIDSEGMALVSDFLSNNSTTTVLSLGGNEEINIDNVTNLCNLMHKNGAVRELSLGSCELGLPTFLNSKCMTDQLVGLDLSGNRITAKGAVMVADYLERNPALIELNLESNMLPASAAARFAIAMKSNTNLKHLNLAKNHFTGKSTPSFVELLKGNKTLLSLSLTGNNIKVDTETGRKWLIQNALCDATSLDAILNSNHSCQLTFSRKGHKSTYEMEMRNINALENEGQKIRYKVVLAFFAINKELFNPEGFDGVPLELMPRLLELVQQEIGYRGFGKGIVDATRKRRNSNEDPTLDQLYKVVHRWNLPLLFERGPGKPEKKQRKRKRS